MARAVDKIAKEIEKQTADQMAADIAAKENTYNLNVGAINDNYAVDVANTEEAYNKLYDTNAVSRIVNERKIAENMANLGLTDSGLNRTQQTANQLSYANTNNQIGIQKQKAIDTLARTMRNKITELDIQKNEDIAGIKSAYKQSAMQQATDIHNAEVKAEADMYEASLKAMSDAQQNADKMKKDMYNDYYKSDGIYHILSATEDVKDKYGNVIGTKSKYNDEKKANQFLRWIDTYVTDYSDKKSSEMVGEYVTKLAPGVQEKVIAGLNKEGMYVYVETPAVKRFLDKIPTAFEFNTKKMQEKEIRNKYAGHGGGYEKYISDLTENDSSLTDNDIATIAQALGLIS